MEQAGVECKARLSGQVTFSLACSEGEGDRVSAMRGVAVSKLAQRQLRLSPDLGKSGTGRRPNGLPEVSKRGAEDVAEVLRFPEHQKDTRNCFLV